VTAESPREIKEKSNLNSQNIQTLQNPFYFFSLASIFAALLVSSSSQELCVTSFGGSSNFFQESWQISKPMNAFH
jgi:hypothetical protein